METFESGGVAVTYTVHGSGPPLLFLHPEHFFAWNRTFVGQLAAKRQVIVPRHPGFDGKPPPPDFRRVDDLAYLYLDLIERLDLRDVLLVGASLGGWIALEMAVRDRSRLARLALIAPTGVKLGGREERDFADLFALSEAEIRKALFADPDRWAPDYANLDDAEMETIARERQYAAWYGWKPYMHNPVLARWLHRIDLPTLLLWGEADGYVPPAHGERLARLLPGGWLHRLAGAGHYPQIEQSAATADLILNFDAAPRAAAVSQGGVSPSSVPRGAVS